MKAKKEDWFPEFEKEPLRITFMGGMCIDKAPYKEYQETFEVALDAIREAVHEGAMDEEEGRRLLKQCRRV